MSITIENPSARTIFAVVRLLPKQERRLLRELLDTEDSKDVDESSDWSDEDLRDLDRATAKLIDERFGPEEGNYD